MVILVLLASSSSIDVNVYTAKKNIKKKWRKKERKKTAVRNAMFNERFTTFKKK